MLKGFVIKETHPPITTLIGASTVPTAAPSASSIAKFKPDLHSCLERYFGRVARDGQCLRLHETALGWNLTLQIMLTNPICNFEHRSKYDGNQAK
jgi:hypothetical protein